MKAADYKHQHTKSLAYPFITTHFGKHKNNFHVCFATERGKMFYDFISSSSDIRRKENKLENKSCFYFASIYGRICLGEVLNENHNWRKVSPKAKTNQRKFSLIENSRFSSWGLNKSERNQINLSQISTDENESDVVYYQVSLKTRIFTYAHVKM